MDGLWFEWNYCEFEKRVPELLVMGRVILTNQHNLSIRWRGELENMMYNHLGERLEFF